MLYVKGGAKPRRKCIGGEKLRHFQAISAKMVVFSLLPKQRHTAKRIWQVLQKEGFSKTASELLFEVVSRAYERQSLAVMTNNPAVRIVD